MANQPPFRPWFRLASVPRPPAPSAPAPEPAAVSLAQIAPPAPQPRPPFRAALPQVIRPAAQPQPAEETAPPPPAPPSPAAPPQPRPLAATPPSPPVATPPPPLAATPPPLPAATVVSPRPVATFPPAASPKPSQLEAINVLPSRIPESPVTASPITESLPTSITPRSPVITASPATKALPTSPSPKTPKTPYASVVPSARSPTSVSPRPSSPLYPLPSYAAPEGSPQATILPAKVAPTHPTPSPSKPITATTTVPTVTSMTVPETARLQTPKASPRLVKPVAQTPPQSPKTRPTVPPPSPFVLPPVLRSEGEPELKIPAETEKKTVLVQETVEKPSHITGIIPNGKQGKHNGKDIHRRSSDSEEIGMRIITIAGENKGALMELAYSPGRNGIYKGNRQGYSLRGSADDSETNLSGKDDGSKMKDRNRKAATSTLPVYMNSNVQGVNNSIVYNSACTHHDPGVHLSLSRKPFNGNGIHHKDHVNGKRM